ncbi:hypothetical protein ACFYKX_05445 [Cytobacillus sp. FJAT-54145]|uniref:DUF3899 domain-containing protein n=1 Tax=Cytobacillus spartinae TaxID=3299023 RepID=A0ABW6KBG2_9BACI
MRIKKFLKVVIASVLIQFMILIALWYFVFNGVAFSDFTVYFSGIVLAIVLFFSSSGDAWTNSVIASNFIIHGDSGHREQREFFHVRLNPILTSSFFMLVISVGYATLVYYM